MAVQCGQLLAQPPPQPFYRHQVRAVGRQVHQLDSQLVRVAGDCLGVMVALVVPDQGQGAVGIAVAQRTEHLVGRLCVGPMRGPHSHRLGGSKGVEAEAGELLG